MYVAGPEDKFGFHEETWKFEQDIIKKNHFISLSLKIWL